MEGNRAAMAMNGQASIITKMVLNQIGKKRYNLATNFLGSDKEGKRVYALVMGLKPPPNRTSQDYENELYDALLKNRATTLGVRVESKVEKRLMLELAKMKKKCLRLENICKGQLITIDKLTHHKTNKRARNKQIEELQRRQRKEDRYQDKMEEDRPDYCRYDGSETKFDARFKIHGSFFGNMKKNHNMLYGTHRYSNESYTHGTFIHVYTYMTCNYIPGTCNLTSGILCVFETGTVYSKSKDYHKTNKKQSFHFYFLGFQSLPLFLFLCTGSCALHPSKTRLLLLLLFFFL